jgi:hypothetical protein
MAGLSKGKRNEGIGQDNYHGIGVHAYGLFIASRIYREMRNGLSGGNTGHNYKRNAERKTGTKATTNTGKGIILCHKQ